MLLFFFQVKYIFARRVAWTSSKTNLPTILWVWDTMHQEIGQIFLDLELTPQKRSIQNAPTQNTVLGSNIQSMCLWQSLIHQYLFVHFHINFYLSTTSGLIFKSIKFHRHLKNKETQVHNFLKPVSWCIRYLLYNPWHWEQESWCLWLRFDQWSAKMLATQDTRSVSQYQDMEKPLPRLCHFVISFETTIKQTWAIPESLSELKNENRKEVGFSSKN